MKISTSEHGSGLAARVGGSGTSARVGDSASLALQVLSEGQYFNIPLSQAFLRVGYGAQFDVPLVSQSRKDTALFALLKKPSIHEGAEDIVELIPEDMPVRLNGKLVRKAAPLRAFDRVEWDGAEAVVIRASGTAEQSELPKSEFNALELLNRLSKRWEEEQTLSQCFDFLLQKISEVCGAEKAVLIADVQGQGMQEMRSWELLSLYPSSEDSVTHSRKTLLSDNILQKALRERRSVHIENIIGHDFSTKESVVASRIFSVACLPLIVGARVMGALFLYTQTPGKTLEKRLLDDIQLLVTQAALLLTAEKERRSQKAMLKKESSQAKDIFWGSSSAMQTLKERTEKVARTKLSVLVRGETGTGKELVARRIHALSERSDNAFVAVNCAAVPATLLESYLFGHAKGAFTGAEKKSVGKFELASGGTLFLDEIGELSEELQVKLLRVIQEGVIEPVGSQAPIKVDVRLVSATHQNLETLISEGKFRQDLYYRLCGIEISSPALRERIEDLAELSEHLLSKHGAAARLAPSAIKLFENHRWAGNVRELEQTLLRASVLCNGGIIEAEDCEISGLGNPEGPEALTLLKAGRALGAAQAEFTNKYVDVVLQKANFNRAKAAELLQISERQLYRLLAAREDATLTDGGVR